MIADPSSVPPEPLTCPYAGCGREFGALSALQSHVRLAHRRGRSQVCPQPGCGKSFYLESHLRRHLGVHSGGRGFTCDTCGKAFKRRTHLEAHGRTHLGETPLQ